MAYIRFTTSGITGKRLTTRCKRLFALGVSFALMLSALPSYAASGTLGERTTELTLGAVSSKTTELYPLDIKERDIGAILNLVYDSLITIDDDYVIQPNLAESWSVSSNGKTWKFQIKSDVFFSNGQPLTAYDCAATITRILEMANDETGGSIGTYSTMKWYITSAAADDDRTLVIKANRPYYGLLYALTFPILPQAQVYDASPAGTGPYIVYNFSPGEFLWLNQNDYYWKQKPQIREIMYMFSVNNKEMMSDYEYSRLDGIATRSIAASQYQSGKNAFSLSYRTQQLETLVINCRQSSLSLNSANMRKAIRAAINVDNIANQVYMKMALRTDTPFPAGTWMYKENEEYGYNIELANQLLDAEGWLDSNNDGFRDKTIDGKLTTLTLRLFYYEEPNNSVRAEVADIIAAQLAQVGIGTKIQMYSFANMKEKLKANSFDLALVAYNMDTVPDPGFFLLSGNAENYGRYRSETMSNLVKALRAAVEFDDYRQCLHDIQDYFAQDCPFVCLYYRRGMILTRFLFTDARDIREAELYKGISTWSN
ncbi:MAG: ABC transporter substrate-binding protein [Eubacteriales bacterium]|nr:ABC transporter substrate-binding protein [Eubacteriales bacterium]MDD3881609.1 ABC transporter substrate-binding protein [Eubacteriales bacterium]MDD4512332.1 ABC transporter substrate-binding protein [Eubacteriales bacterium]